MVRTAIRKVKRTFTKHRKSISQEYVESILGVKETARIVKSLLTNKLGGWSGNHQRPYGADHTWTQVTFPFKHKERAVQVIWDGRRFCYLRNFDWASFSEVRGSDWADPTEMIYNLLAILGDPHPGNIIKGAGCISFHNRMGELTEMKK